MNELTVRLGFAVGSGEVVTIPIRHTCVTGQTQEAGKTTTLEALIARSKLRALAFSTKRGEGAFSGGRLVAPYFREQADWRCVSSMLEAFLGERLKFERSWIMRASKGARTLADVRGNVLRLMDKAKGLSADVYMVLNEYLGELVPAIAAVRWAPGVALQPGLNVMDLTDIPASLQHLVIKSALDWVLERETDTVVVIPEAWKFCPQGRGTPVKLSAQAYIRQGAALRNYLWLDSQDIGGIDKEVLRSVPVWILGVQREANEIKRTLLNIPASVAKPKAADIATLELGEFVACWGRHAIKTYVQPAGMQDMEARGRAQGTHARLTWAPSPSSGSPRVAARPKENGHDAVEVLERFVGRGRAAQDAVDVVLGGVHVHVPAATARGYARGSQPKGSDDMTPAQEKKLDTLVEQMTRLVATLANPIITSDGKRPAQRFVDSGESKVDATRPPGRTPAAVPLSSTLPFEELYALIKDRLVMEAVKDPRILEVLVSQPEIRVKIERHTIQVGDDTLRGRLALLIADGFFDDAKEAGKAFAEVVRRGFKTAHPNVSRELGELSRMGFLTRSNKWYQAVPAMKLNVVGV